MYRQPTSAETYTIPMNTRNLSDTDDSGYSRLQDPSAIGDSHAACDTDGTYASVYDEPYTDMNVFANNEYLQDNKSPSMSVFENNEYLYPNKSPSMNGFENNEHLHAIESPNNVYLHTNESPDNEYLHDVAEPEVLAKGDELSDTKEVGSGEEAVHIPGNVFKF